MTCPIELKINFPHVLYLKSTKYNQIVNVIKLLDKWNTVCSQDKVTYYFASVVSFSLARCFDDILLKGSYRSNLLLTGRNATCH